MKIRWGNLRVGFTMSCLMRKYFDFWKITIVLPRNDRLTKSKPRYGGVLISLAGKPVGIFSTGYKAPRERCSIATERGLIYYRNRDRPHTSPAKPDKFGYCNVTNVPAKV